MKNNLAVIILAAGKGTRMDSELPKVLHLIDDEPMILKVLKSSYKINANPIITIVGVGDLKMPQVSSPETLHHPGIQDDRHNNSMNKHPSLSGSPCLMYRQGLHTDTSLCVTGDGIYSATDMH